LSVEDLKALATYHGHKEPSFYGKFQNFERESWIGKQYVQMMKDTKVLGPFKGRF
jgi:hypothetical protein